MCAILAIPGRSLNVSLAVIRTLKNAEPVFEFKQGKEETADK